MELPVTLDKSPLLDALFEVRFRPSMESAGEILPGILFQELKEEYADGAKLPLASVPPEIRDRDPKLRHQAHYRLQGTGKQISVGHRVFNFSFGVEYPGWQDFCQEIMHLLELLPSSGLVGEVERYSLRYVNLIPFPEGNQLGLLDANIQLRGEHVSERGFHLRTEFSDDEFLNVVQLRTGATATLPDQSSRSGLIVDIDTIRTVSSEEFWSERESYLERGHDTLKQTFFSLLTENTIETFGPTWEEDE